MQAILDEITQTYSIDPDVAKELIERAAGQCLSRSMGVDAYACLDDRTLRFLRFDSDIGEVPIKTDKLHRRVVRNLRFAVGRIIQAEVASKEFTAAKRLLHTAVPGVVRRALPSGDVAVALGQGEQEITATCPFHALMPSDLPVAIGQEKLWYVTKVEMKTGSTPRIDIQLSRKSKELVACMIRQQAALVTDCRLRFSVLRRIPGQMVEIEAWSFVPHVAIKHVAAELGEKIKFVKGARNGGKRG